MWQPNRVEASTGVALAAAAILCGWPAAAAADLEAARAAKASGDTERAWSLVEEALTALPEDGETFAFLVQLGRDTGNFYRVERELRRQLRGGRAVATTEWALGRTYLWRGQPDQAILHFERALADERGPLEAALDLAEAHLATGRSNGMGRVERSLNEAHPRLAEVAGALGRAWVLVETGRAEAAAALLAATDTSDPDVPLVIGLRAVAELRAGQPERVAPLVARAKRLPGSVDHLAWQSRLNAIAIRAARMLGQMGRAQDQLGTALEHAETYALAAERVFLRVLEVAMHVDRGEHQAALEVASEALVLTQTEGRGRRAARLALADVELARFRPRAANEYLRQILASIARSQDERDLPAVLLRLGKGSMAAGAYLEAVQYFAEAAERGTAGARHPDAILATAGEAKARSFLSEYAAALELGKTALEMAEAYNFPRGASTAHCMVGDAYLQLGDLEAARNHFGQALEIAHDHALVGLQGRAYLNLGVVADALGHQTEAEDWIRQALTAALRARDLALDVDCRTEIAERQLDVGEYDDALNRFGHALEIATGAGYLRGRGANLTLTGETHKLLGDHQRALGYFSEGARLARSTHNRVGEAANLKHMGEVFSLLGDSRTAMAHLERALNTNRRTGHQQGEGEVLLALCQALNAGGRYAEARGHGERVMILANANGNATWQARAAIQLGNSLFGLGDAERAGQYFDHARLLADRLERRSLAWPANMGLSRVFETAGATDQAIEAARDAVGTLEELRSGLNLPERRAGFMEDRLAAYETLVGLLVDSGKNAEAFQFMEYSRSRAFLELLSREQVAGDSPAIAALRDEELWLGRKITRATEQLARRPMRVEGDQITSGLLQTLGELRARQTEIRQLIGPAEPTAAILTGARPLALGEVQERLAPHEAMIEYYVMGDRLVTFIITQAAVEVVSQPESAPHLEARVKLLREAIASPPEAGASRADWLEPAQGLHRLLIHHVVERPALYDVADLWIIPHRFLHHVPFHALAAEDARFLVEDFNVAYGPSASVVAHCLAADGGRPTNALALANPNPEDLRGAKLPYVKDEVQAVLRTFGNHAQVFVDEAATESIFKAWRSGNDIIHIATHFEVDPRDPFASALNLASSADDDGRLEIREVMQQSIDAKLVVLSGCSTATAGAGLVNLPNSDDWVSLTRAFIYAGAPSVLATLWPVNDRAAAGFMGHFYDRLPFRSKARAVCEAQRNMLALALPDGADRDPYAWAPFVLVGSGR